jgi:hypothetical protein
MGHERISRRRRKYIVFITNYNIKIFIPVTVRPGRINAERVMTTCLRWCDCTMAKDLENRGISSVKRTFRTPTVGSSSCNIVRRLLTSAMRARSPCTPLHAWHAGFYKRLIGDSYRNPSVLRCAELQFSDLTHHQRPRCPLMKQDRWTAAMEKHLGKVSPRMVGVEQSR